VHCDEGCSKGEHGAFPGTLPLDGLGDAAGGFTWSSYMSSSILQKIAAGVSTIV
jgi:hypothetical protein